jgi:hypothetical protein
VVSEEIWDYLTTRYHGSHEIQRNVFGNGTKDRFVVVNLIRVGFLIFKVFKSSKPCCSRARWSATSWMSSLDRLTKRSCRCLLTWVSRSTTCWSSKRSLHFKDPMRKRTIAGSGGTKRRAIRLPHFIKRSINQLKTLLMVTIWLSSSQAIFWNDHRRNCSVNWISMRTQLSLLK